MAIKIERKKVSKNAWSDVDEGALGKRLAEGYAKDEVTAAQIHEVYAFVPDDAFTIDAAGKTFAHAKAWGPHFELVGETLALNRDAVRQVASELSGTESVAPFTAHALAEAKSHLRRHLRQLKETNALNETLRRVERPQSIEEMVKGSLEYALMEVNNAFRQQFYPSDMPYEYRERYWICDTFADVVIVQSYVMASDEFFLVKFERNGKEIVFAPREQWELVELTYKLPTPAPAASTEANEVAEMSEVATESEPEPEAKAAKETPKEESKKNGSRGRKRFTEDAQVLFSLEEAAGSNGSKLKVIRANKAMTADIVNDNGRRYRNEVLRAAVEEVRKHLNESPGQGRLVQLLGEAEHPSTKGKRPNVLETVVKWNEIDFDDKNVSLAGNILETSKGKDILALVEGGVTLSLSARGYGDSEFLEEDGQTVEEIVDFHLTGFDLLLEPGFADARALVESKTDSEESDEMDPEKFKEMLKAHPELFPGVTEEQVTKMNADQLKGFEEKLRAAIGLDPNADLLKEIIEGIKAKKDLEEAKRAKAIDEAIAVATKDLKYGKLNDAFKQELVEAKAATPEDVKRIAEGLVKRYDAILAQAKLAGMGFGNDVQVLGPVLEGQTDTPAYAKHAFEIVEQLTKREHVKRRDLQKPKTINERATVQMLELFDKQYKRQLIQESKVLEEAETTSDLSLPYGVSRAIIATVWPQLIASGLFDFGVTDQAPTKIFYEKFVGETGMTATVTDEDVTASNPLGSWVQLTAGRAMLNPGTVVVTNSGGGTTYVEGTDYVIDYYNGKFMALSGGAISAGQALKVDYTYEAIRKGENAAIERGKLQLLSDTLEIAANRLAQQLTNEAIVFSRSQLGWDATARTLANLINELRRKIDEAAVRLALTSALRVASNSGGTWTQASDPLSDLPVVIGATRVKLTKRYYRATALLLSETNADMLGNWEGFTAAGKRPSDDLDAEGYVGRIKGMPVFHTTEFSDAFGLVLNRELVAHRVYQALAIKGPFPTYEASTGKLIAADQYYVEQYDGAISVVPEKGSYFRIA